MLTYALRLRRAIQKTIEWFVGCMASPIQMSVCQGGDELEYIIGRESRTRVDEENMYVQASWKRW